MTAETDTADAAIQTALAALNDHVSALEGLSDRVSKLEGISEALIQSETRFAIAHRLASLHYEHPRSELSLMAGPRKLAEPDEDGAGLLRRTAFVETLETLSREIVAAQPKPR